jgi:hypothetical protein
MTNDEIHDGALARFGSEPLARQLAIVRHMHADLQAVARQSEYRSDDAERSCPAISLPT